jgi:hypothetical protein
MDPIVEEFTISLKYQVSVDTETGEMTTKCISRKIDKSNFEVTEAKKKSSKAKKEESTTPELTLEDNKYYLNSAAIELMGVSPDDKLDIKYEKKDNTMIPVIGTDESFGTRSGNRLTKSNSVAFRGSKNEELAKYGKVFTIIPHDKREGLFILQGDSKTENSFLEEISKNVDFDLDLSDIDKDAKEIDSSFFQL